MADESLGFGQELDELRRERGLSFEQLAAASGLSRTYLQDIVAGRRGHRPSEQVVVAVAQALEVPADRFRLTRARAVLAHPTAIDKVYERLRAAR